MSFIFIVHSPDPWFKARVLPRVRATTYDGDAGRGRMGTLSDFARKARTLIIGGARSVEDPDLFKKLSLAALLAWVGLGSDGLTSACYGPEEAFLALGARIPLGVFVAAATALTIFVIAASYSQIVEVFPSGGGGYLVASKLLSPGLGMASGCALLVDYVLTISLSIAAGA